MMKPLAGSWCNKYEVPIEEAVCWKIGALRLYAVNKGKEWQIASILDEKNYNNDFHYILPFNDPIPAEAVVKRFATAKPIDSVSLVPLLADRSVVARPVTPFYVLPNDEIALYLSSPLWLQILLGPTGLQLDEMPISRPSDTWFGPTTRDGEMCYALKTRARLVKEELGLRRQMAITQTTLINRTKAPFLLEKIKIPVEFLTLFADNEGFLWTNNVTFVKDEHSDLVKIEIQKRANSLGSQARIISEPRRKTEKNLLIRAFSSII